MILFIGRALNVYNIYKIVSIIYIYILYIADKVNCNTCLISIYSMRLLLYQIFQQRK